MKLKSLILLSFMALLFPSCSRVYSPALYQHDIAYQPKPASFDSVKSKIYISAGYNTYSNANYSDAIQAGQLNISSGHVFNNFNLAYGAFGSFGDYQDGSGSKSSAYYFNDKYFGAIGGRVSANLFTKNDNADIRFIGMEAAYSHEFGDYASYRKSVIGVQNIYVDPRTGLFTVGLTTEVIFHNRDNTLEHGIRGFLGTTLGHNDLNDTYYQNDSSQERFLRSIFPEASYFIRYKNYFATAEIGNQLFIRVGFAF